MELVFVALILFAGLIVCWLILPGGAAVAEVQYGAEPVAPSTVQQVA
jgi:hypothetical protein